MTITYKDYIVEIINDSEYSDNSADNTHDYNKFYVADADSPWRSHKHRIKISKNATEITSAIVCGFGGSTTIHEKSFVVKEDALFICCGDTEYSLNLPELNLNWGKKIDPATCFGIYKFNDDMLIHGEMEITRITIDGTVKWNFSARDIFVTENGSKSFEISDNEIHLWDWEGYNYILNGNGEIIR